MGSLFRPEAIDGQRQAWLGSIRLIRPLSMTLLTGLMVGMVALTLAYLTIGHYTRRAHLGGALVPDFGLIRLVPPQAATLAEVHAREGQTVQPGDLLFVLAVDPATRGGAPRRVEVRAPQGGVLGALGGAAGQRVSPTTALVSLAPTQPRLQAQLYAPSNLIGLLRPGQPVLLRYQAFPSQSFGHHPGQVLSVARTPIPASELAGLSLATAATGAGPFIGAPNPGEPLYRITVALDNQTVSADGQALSLAAGMRLEAEVQLDRRRLIEWLFEPALGLAGRT